ncbi:MAG: DUF4287 domain-containing protein [Propionibacteriales bacterium]|nr:DUF4287 domain-containing protein [Propionibacteriales bacterium]MBW8901920.1 DUF4287 domain-containing protein [Massilia sp.]
MNEQRKPVGPASYFDSIERKYGEPVEHWIELIHAHAPARHSELVDWLKGDYGLGHGHANALVAHALAQRAVTAA